MDGASIEGEGESVTGLRRRSRFMDTLNQKTSRLKMAELMSGIGAVVLGMGLGLLFSRFLSPYTTPLILIGLLTHA
jgi:F0F1-type ATP synthase assembly protein I